MPLLYAFFAMLSAAIGPMLIRFLVSIGVGAIVFTGVDTFVTQYQSTVMASLSGMPAGALQIIGILKIGTCVNIMFSALAMRAAVAGMNAGSVKKLGAA